MYLRNLKFILPLLLLGCSNSQNTKGGDSSSSQAANGTTGGGASTTLSVGGLRPVKGSVVHSGKQVIINAANPRLAAGGSLSGAIYSAAGTEHLYKEIRENFGLTSDPDFKSGATLLLPGRVFTTSAHNLKSKGTEYIIHALGPNFTQLPYSAHPAQGYADLRITYKTIFEEMKRLYTSSNVTSIGVIPISAGVYAGSADKTTIFSIMIEETFKAIRSYPYLQPELYLYDQTEFDQVAGLLQPIYDRMLGTATLSSTASYFAVGGASAHLTLMDVPIYQKAIGGNVLQGASYKLGPLQILGMMNSNQYQTVTDMMGGVNSGKVMFGLGVEFAYQKGELTHYAVKAKGMYKFLNGFAFSGGLGYMQENTAVGMQNNILQFFKQFGIQKQDHVQKGMIAEGVIQYKTKLNSISNLMFDVGLRSMYCKSWVNVPLIQTSLDLNDVQVSAFVTKYDFGFNFTLNN
ncbi:MAG: macro domain-containing protein [Candidatus Paracaedibacteraceae bacterium]|nr:macro domain-containing protein [Candidatus Paracaedibacteraceae bacterium]